jgi:FAD/FMN-containing dehydrogenase
MPRSLREILQHAGALERRFAKHDPTEVRAAVPRVGIRAAVTERAAERHVAEAIAAARQAGVSWSVVGGMLDTSGEAARKRYGGQPAKTA